MISIVFFLQNKNFPTILFFHGNAELAQEYDDIATYYNRFDLNFIVYILSWIAFLSFGAEIFVDGAIYLARYFGLSEVVIGMSVVAFGTSLPELATSVMAAFHKESSISVGNIIGSNIFNILSVLGITSIIYPLDSPRSIMGKEVLFMLAYAFSMFIVAKLPQPINIYT